MVLFSDAALLQFRSSFSIEGQGVQWRRPGIKRALVSAWESMPQDGVP
jgi:hypothetical protein